MELRPFKLERYFARWEFAARYLLCSSDVEGMRLDELLALADDEARDRWNELTLGYTEAPGHPALRAEIGRLYETIAPEEVYTFAGAEEAIYIAVNLLVGPGDHAIVTWPGYQSLYEIARARGAEVTLHVLEPDRAFALDVEALARQVRPNTKLIVTNFPHNPSGALPDRATFSRLAELADSVGATLLSDEVYRLTERDEADRLPAASDISRRAVSVGVMSKAFGLAGLRVGWLATHDASLLSRAAAYKDYTSIGNSAPSEILSLIALRAKSAVLARSRAILTPNLARLDRFFHDHGDLFQWVAPRAGTVGFPRLVADVSTEDFAAALVEEEGVLLLPGSAYHHAGEPEGPTPDAASGTAELAWPRNHFRIGFGRTNMPAALAGLERFTRRRFRR